MEYPVQVALAGAVTTLPTGPGWWYEPKLDGDRAVVWRRDTVRVQTRSGRDATPAWIDIATAAMDLPPDTVLDGEAVIWRDGRTDFGAVRSRTSARGRRLADLIHRYPASYVAFDCLMLDGRDLRGRPYLERRQALLDVLEPLGPPLQAVPATDDLEVARVWFEVLPEQGIEGIVAKRATGVYRPDRSWRKVRTAETVDVAIVGYTGPPARPRHIVVRLPDGRRVRSQTLTAPLASDIGRYLTAASPGEHAHTTDGEPYTTTDAAVVVEAAAGTTRHAVVTITRIR
ncbi:ATP-dependent DNA ligase [Streptomyces venezuelae]|uniref:ATP-dependent DNA ligase n=1 Tax=Streptomyces venezuelae TaxID=54571 RepID=A0A5P2BMS1_STRVZ|nr:ATP-dependent DNA ligase [Streptomyces venezuelae]QES31270.1 ATP-dependent DNA ligase [Streptomyces venezuelae]